MKKLLMLTICLLFAVPSFAITGISLGVKGGLVTDYNQPGFSVPNQETDNMALAGLQVRLSSLPIVDLIVTGEYAWKNESYSVLGQDFELKRHDFLFSASAIYPVKLPAVSPYLGGGVATHSLGYDYAVPALWSLEDYDIEVPGNETKMGYHIMGGVDFKLPVFPVSANAEFRINWVNTPQEVTKYNSITIGLSYSLP